MEGGREEGGEKGRRKGEEKQRRDEGAKSKG